MDLLEKVFEKYWAVRKSRKKRKALSHSVELAEIREYLEVAAGFVGPKTGRLQISAGLHFTGIWEQTLILPEAIELFPQKELNRAAYLGLTLRACMAAQLRLSGNAALTSRNAQRLEYLSVSPQINRALDAFFPHFHELDAQLLGGSGLAQEGWIRALQSREEATLKLLGLPEVHKTKSGDQLKPWVQALIPCLPQRVPPDFFGVPTDAAENRSSSSGTQQESQKGEMIRRVDLQKEKSNPVTHSFEKLETADDYTGGHRTEDGDDALENQSSALEEVEMSQVTLSGTPTHSVYKTDQASLPNRRLDDLTAPIAEQKRYAEWSESRGAYLPDYCLLNALSPLPVQPFTPNEPSLRGGLAERYAKDLPAWRRQLSHLLNEPQWMKRQIEGSEIDLDAVVRYLTDIRVADPGPQRLYAQKRVGEQSLAIQILFDQSLSTDAWVKNRRVIDLILDSIGLCGILFDGILPEIQVTGTWSATRNNCRVQVYKQSDEPWDSFFGRAGLVVPQGYTRLGPSIRYSADILKKQGARRKVLLLLTDGKPSDLDPYEGFHGIHDVKKACAEAEVFGIQTIALAIDQRHRSHFSVMFKHPIVLSDPSSLPAQLIQTLLKIIRK